jgi:hypothetical protein
VAPRNHAVDGGARARPGSPSATVALTLPPLIPSSPPPPQIKSYYQDSKTLGELGLKASSPIEVKDLGFQFSYRGVFFLEYLGPIVIVALYALRSPLLFGEGSTPVSFSEALTSTCAKAPAGSGEWNGFVQALAIVLWCLHFVKREFET